jgi:hypothetical protein
MSFPALNVFLISKENSLIFFYFFASLSDDLHSKKTTAIRKFGRQSGYSTSAGEAAMKMVKRPYRLTNHKDYQGQVIPMAVPPSRSSQDCFFFHFIFVTPWVQKRRQP